MPLVLPLVDGRVVVVLVLVPVRPLVPAVGRLPVTVGLEVVVGRVVVPAVGRLVVVPADMLPFAVGRVVEAEPLIEPELGRPETVAPFCVVPLPLGLPPLIEPAVLLLCLTLAT